MQFSHQDETDLREREISPAELIETIYRFTHQTEPIQLERPCVPGDGILTITSAEERRYADAFEKLTAGKTIVKFVPASGAASRMFAHLFQYDIKNPSPLIEEFIFNIDLFAFYPLLKSKISENGLDIDQLISENAWTTIFDFILGEKGLHYAIFPKGLIPFHRYADGSIRTAFEEHMHEAVDYGRESDGTCRIHFTLSPHQTEMVMTFLSDRTQYFPYEKFILSHSIQKSKTDTPAIDKNNHPVRDSNGKIVFRPAGHGALIHNLQELEEDIIFIKNIDNVTTADQKQHSIFYKKIIAGLLIDLKSTADDFLDKLDSNDHSVLNDAILFIKKWFNPHFVVPNDETLASQKVKLQLDRPMRVCGMVKNEGEPGGGPFWVKMKNGELSKQIVEKSQINHHDFSQMKILSNATHFNPVDIVCCIKNRHGVKYTLEQFIDHSTGFISEKLLEGQAIKALELPGLWNGSMALWNTIFIEVPVSTFNPVKTVNDLLRTGHQTA